MVVTPKARLEYCIQFCCGVIWLRACPPWAWASMKPGTMVLPETSATWAPAGISTSPRRPTATIRFPLDHYGAVFDHLFGAVHRVTHGDDPAADEGDRSIRLIELDVEADVDALLDRLGQLVWRPLSEREGLVQVALVENRAPSSR